MRWPRRVFLRNGSIAAVGIGSGLVGFPGFLARAAEAGPGTGKVLVVLFLRGAADGLNVLVPHGEPGYYEARPSIAVAPPRKGDARGAAIDLDGTFGLHPALRPLKRLWDDGLLSVVTAVGSPSATRSHFDAQDFMETGTPGVRSTRDGWLNRYLLAAADRAAGFRAVSLTSQLPRVLRGSAQALAVPDVAEFDLRVGRNADLSRRGLEALYARSADPVLAATAQETFEAMDFLARANPASHRPADGVVYPGAEPGRSLAQIAQLIKAGVGLEIAFSEVGGWDHHVNEGGADGALAGLLRPLGAALAAFARDLGPKLDDVVVVTLSEFGRTVRENGNRGTDHGHATSMFVLGGPVRGRRVLGDWPGLAPDRLHEGRDLALTTDFRAVLTPLLTRHLSAPGITAIFPGFDGTGLGVLRGATESTTTG